MRRTLPLLIATILAFAGMVGSSGPVRAECPYFVIPPATDAARSAREIIVGTVIENVGGQLYDFRLRVDQVMRGPAKVGDVRRFEFLYPGWPTYEAGDGTIIVPCAPIPGWEGNVIAFSLGALGTDGTTRYDAASWISGRLPVDQDVPRTTLAQMSRLAGLPQTDSAAPLTPAQRADERSGSALLVLVGAFIVGLGLGARRRRPGR